MAPLLDPILGFQKALSVSWQQADFANSLALEASLTFRLGGVKQLDAAVAYLF